MIMLYTLYLMRWRWCWQSRQDMTSCIAEVWPVDYYTYIYEYLDDDQRRGWANLWPTAMICKNWCSIPFLDNDDGENLQKYHLELQQREEDDQQWRMMIREEDEQQRLINKTMSRPNKWWRVDDKQIISKSWAVLMSRGEEQRWWADIETMSSVDDEQMISSIDQQHNRLKNHMRVIWQWTLIVIASLTCFWG